MTWLTLEKGLESGAAEQDRIWESAVEIVAANKPAKITPTSMAGKRLCDRSNSANSGSFEVF